jgi:hypothetical protein
MILQIPSLPKKGYNHRVCFLAGIEGVRAGALVTLKIRQRIVDFAPTVLGYLFVNIAVQTIQCG